MSKDKGQFLMLVQVRQGSPWHWLEISYLELFVNTIEVDEEDGEEYQGYDAHDHDKDDHSLTMSREEALLGVIAVEE